MSVSGFEATSLYDEVPYTSLSYSESHPDRLATIAMLFGMSPAPVAKCRVLELGCAGGGNLVPMAHGLPGSQFLGIDLSRRQIEQGRRTVADLGLENVTLEPLDILDVDSDLGVFDYIIAHGVYSWVPASIQDKLFEVCRQCLAPHGVAYVSYNTYPGWSMIGVVRDLMLYHTRDVSDPLERVDRARSIVRFVREAVPDQSGAYAAFLHAYSDLLGDKKESSKGSDGSFVLHDELAEVNEPTYFSDFIEHAGRHGLQYLSEAQYHRTEPHDLSAESVEQLENLAQDRIEYEQYLDFLRNRTFRQTLLVHSDVVLSRKIQPEKLMSFYVASHSKPDADAADPDVPGVAHFRDAEGRSISTNHPVSKAAMLRLGRSWPLSVRFDHLFSGARMQMGLGPTDGDLGLDVQALAETVLAGYGYTDSLVELHVYQPGFALDIGARPHASPVARSQAKERMTVTNLRHERVRLDAFSRYLLLCLDGKHDRGALTRRFMEGPVADGILSIKSDDVDRGEGDMVSLLEEEIEARLTWLAQASLLCLGPGRAGG